MKYVCDDSRYPNIAAINRVYFLSSCFENDVAILEMTF